MIDSTNDFSGSICISGARTRRHAATLAMTTPTVRLFNGATDEDVRAFEESRARGDGAEATRGDDSRVIAVFRRPRGFVRWSEAIAECNGQDPLRFNEWDTRHGCFEYCVSSIMVGFLFPIACVLASPCVLCHWSSSRAYEVDDRTVVTERRAYRIVKECKYDRKGKEYHEMVWRRADWSQLSDARRVKPYCFCCGGFDGVAVRVSEEAKEFQNHVIQAAGEFTQPQDAHGRLDKKRFEQIQKEHPAEAVFRLSTNSPKEALELVHEAMRAVKPEVMTKE